MGCYPHVRFHFNQCNIHRQTDPATGVCREIRPIFSIPRPLDLNRVRLGHLSVRSHVAVELARQPERQRKQEKQLRHRQHGNLGAWQKGIDSRVGPARG